MATHDETKLPPDVGDPRDVETSATPRALDPGQLATAGVVGAILDAINRAARPDELPRSLSLGVSDRVCAALLELGGTLRSTIFATADDCYVIEAVTKRIGSIDVEAQRQRRAPRECETGALTGPDAGEHLESYRFARIDK